MALGDLEWGKKNEKRKTDNTTDLAPLLQRLQEGLALWAGQVGRDAAGEAAVGGQASKGRGSHQGCVGHDGGAGVPAPLGQLALRVQGGQTAGVRQATQAVIPVRRLLACVPADHAEL